MTAGPGRPRPERPAHAGPAAGPGPGPRRRAGRKPGPRRRCAGRPRSACRRATRAAARRPPLPAGRCSTRSPTSACDVREVTLPDEWDLLTGGTFNNVRLPERTEPFLPYLKQDLKLFGVSLNSWMQGLFLSGRRVGQGPARQARAAAARARRPVRAVRRGPADRSRAVRHHRPARDRLPDRLPAPRRRAAARSRSARSSAASRTPRTACWRWPAPTRRPPTGTCAVRPIPSRRRCARRPSVRA